MPESIANANYIKSIDDKPLTKEQLEMIMSCHKNLQDFIDLANKMRKSGKGKGMNYFQQFFLNAKKFV